MFYLKDCLPFSSLVVVESGYCIEAVTVFVGLCVGCLTSFVMDNLIAFDLCFVDMMFWYKLPVAA